MSAAPTVLAARFLHAVRCASSALPPKVPELVKNCACGHWIEIVLVDDDERPVPHEDYRVTAPDGREYHGKLDANGFARVDDLAAGTCRVEFPRIDRRGLARA